jgi:hypothetical protein
MSNMGATATELLLERLVPASIRRGDVSMIADLRGLPVSAGAPFLTLG